MLPTREQIYQGTYECAHLTVNLHASCTVFSMQKLPIVIYNQKCSVIEINSVYKYELAISQQSAY